MSVEAQFYVKIFFVFLFSCIAFYAMQKIQKRKEKNADIKFKQTLSLIETRNKKYYPKENDK